MHAATTDEQRRQLGDSFPCGASVSRPTWRWRRFLASAAFSWITGVTLDVAGGKIKV